MAKTAEYMREYRSKLLSSKRGSKSELPSERILHKADTLFAQHDNDIIGKDVVNVYKVTINGEMVYAMRTENTDARELKKVPKKILDRLPRITSKGDGKPTKDIDLDNPKKGDTISDIDFEKQLQLVNIGSH